MAPGPDRVPVNTNPPGAFVYLNGVVVGQTPTIVSLDRDHPAQIQIYLPGFQPLVMERSKSFNGWFIGSILLIAAVFPLIVDFATGNYEYYDDEPIAIGLTPMAGPPPPYYQQQPQYQQPPPYPPAQQAPPPLPPAQQAPPPVPPAPTTQPPASPSASR